MLAQHFVGEYYQYGYGVKKNEKLAFEYFNKVDSKNFTHGQLRIASDYGNIKAMNNFGLCYEDGKGVKKDNNQAFRLGMAMVTVINRS
ncbi:kinase-like domain-containing protein [Rhizophagus clarus]|uniref:Kinase-like domain-containing protein n=1 Tax=Rhizophagus clarus TaxID=94130 RepID=A0A8H3MCI8_9GLOM|nr:kinase-like domain-containing protein [Rhizophagus clarus]